ncbi:DUF5518 domain-containing protein [Natrinema amylolyticum]|uniref:DUF5518 domain-containing protein n=1 Tax=Natrinema amylolyticum TaxID=2878679 RepID=UPI001CFC090F|nr:DUF5518 domain-containing protein [Natrinema amylolyticum]
MTVTRNLSLRALFEDDAWRIAVIGGCLALPFTTATYVQTGDNIGLEAVFYGGLLAGYLYESGPTDRSRVATRVGLIGALPMLWLCFDTMVIIGTETASPLPFLAVAAIFMVLFTALGFWLSVVVAMLGAWVGDWIRGTVGRIRLPMISH